ncbi:hypothetical protein DSL72_002364 [Monilinia vaccinii-corymbosi]|uniref:ribonuclease H n=1 Tax=Monilinia vaccinii-corymbosi TaxID=61207 RepID=A0A8A3PCF5_9HELO|nr:hypothetical protein DSL72_002364 [Monilinia vaccinii-corymbosi]
MVRWQIKKISSSFSYAPFREIRVRSNSTSACSYREKVLGVNSFETVHAVRDYINSRERTKTKRSKIKKNKNKRNKKKAIKRLREVPGPFREKSTTLSKAGRLLLEKVKGLITLGRLRNLETSKMPPATKKRKFSEEGEGNDKGGSQKFYAVRKGHAKGVFTNWKACLEQITGFSGAMYKSFSTESDAEAFVAGKNPANPSKGDKFYGVAVGHHPGVYEEWAEAEEQIKGVKGPKYKKFTTREEAEEFVRTGRKTNKKAKTVAETGPETKVQKEGGKKVVKGKGKVTVEENAEGIVKRGTVKVWTDGSSRGNGKAGAVAGYGVFFGDGDERNISARLEGDRQTNQRAELTAALRALEIVSIDEHLEIITDSSYTINCATTWYKGWEKRGWKTSTGKEVVNIDLVKKIRERIDERTANGVQTNMTWIKGHDENPGNVAADMLAVKGAMASRE